MTRGGVTIEITGVNEVIARLAQLARRTREMNSAFAEISHVMEAEAHRRVPVRSGRLAASLTASHGRNVARASAGSGLRYGGVIEYGWRRHNISPQPYLVPGADAAEDDAVRILDSEISKTISSVGL